MKLYIKQKVFSWGDKFTVKDEAGRDRYYVEGEIFTFGRKLHVYDMSGREVAFIKQEVWSWMPRYYVFCGDRMELHVAGHEFGMLIEGDRGNLTFQGTRYLGFERG